MEEEKKKKKDGPVKGIVKRVLKKALITMIIFIFLGAAFWGALEGLLEFLSDVINNLGNVYTPTTSINVELSEGINITNEMIDQMIQLIEDKGFTMESLFLSGDTLGLDENSEEYKEARRKYLRQFLLAQVCTQYPDFGIEEDETHYNGIIKIRRLPSTATEISQAYDMTYVVKDKFEAMVNAINSNSMEEGTTSTGKIEYETKNVQFNSKDGDKIKATIIAPAGTTESIPLVVLCHGFTGAKQGDSYEGGGTTFTDLGTTLASNGIATITIDFPGCGESNVNSLGYTLSKMEDYVDKAIEKMKSDYNIDESKIGITGHSMGGRVASLYLDKVSAAALWAPANGDGLNGLEFLGDYNALNTTAQANGQVESGWNYAGTAKNFEGSFILSKKFFDEMADSHPNSKISSFTGSLLIAYDSDDRDGENRVISPETVQAVKSSAPSGTQWIEYDDNHNFSNNGAELIKTTANFFCNSFLGHNTDESGEKVNVLEGYTLEELRELIKNVYTIDNDGNLYFANWKRTDTTTEAGTSNATSISEYYVTIQSVNYKDTVEKYSMPMLASLALCECTQNPQYVYEFIEDFILAGHIDITIMDSLYVDTYNSWYDWQISKREEVYKYEEHTTYDSWDVNRDYPNTTYVWNKKSDKTSNLRYENQHHKTVIINTIESIAQVTDVDTWMAKVNFSYTNEQDIVEYPLGEESVTTAAEMTDPLPNDTSVTNEDTRIDTSYSYDTSNSDNWCKYTQTQNIVHNEWKKVSSEVDEVAIEEKAKNIIAQWDEDFKLPNDNKKAKPGPMIENSTEMLLEALNEEETQRQQEIFKYLIYIYTNNKKYETTLDNSIYNDNELKTVTSEDIIVDVTKSVTRLVLSREQLEIAIKSCYSGEIQENLLSALAAFYKIQQDNKINGTFAIAMAIAESSGGTNWDLIDETTHNWMSVQGSYEGQCYKDRNGTKWRKYKTFAEATEDFGNLIANSSYYFKAGKYTVRNIMETYNPGGAEAESNNIINVMTQLYNSVGVILDSTETGVNRGEGNSGNPGTETKDGSGNVSFTNSFGYTFTIPGTKAGAPSNDCVTVGKRIVASAGMSLQGYGGNNDWSNAHEPNLTNEQKNEIYNLLSQGYAVLVKVKGGPYTTSHHCVPILDYVNGQVYVGDAYRLVYYGGDRYGYISTSDFDNNILRYAYGYRYYK